MFTVFHDISFSYIQEEITRLVLRYTFHFKTILATKIRLLISWFYKYLHMIKDVAIIFKTNLQTSVVSCRYFFVIYIKHRNGPRWEQKNTALQRHLGGVWEYDIYKFPYGKNFWSALVMIRYSDQSITRAVSIILGNWDVTFPSWNDFILILDYGHFLNIT